MKLIYDSIKNAIVDYDNGATIYREDYIGEISLTEVANGEIEFENGQEFTLKDFIALDLEILDFELIT